MADRIQFRRDTSTRWQEVNPTLTEGEIGLVTNNPNQYKIGDGTHAWNDLPLRGFDGTLVHELGDSQTAAMSQKGVTEKITELDNGRNIYFREGYINSKGESVDDNRYLRSVELIPPFYLSVNDDFTISQMYVSKNGVNEYVEEERKYIYLKDTLKYDKVIINIRRIDKTTIQIYDNFIKEFYYNYDTNNKIINIYEETNKFVKLGAYLSSGTFDNTKNDYISTEKIPINDLLGIKVVGDDSRFQTYDSFGNVIVSNIGDKQYKFKPFEKEYSFTSPVKGKNNKFFECFNNIELFNTDDIPSDIYNNNNKYIDANGNIANGNSWSVCALCINDEKVIGFVGEASTTNLVTDAVTYSNETLSRKIKTHGSNISFETNADENIFYFSIPKDYKKEILFTDKDLQKKIGIIDYGYSRIYCDKENGYYSSDGNLNSTSSSDWIYTSKEVKKGDIIIISKINKELYSSASEHCVLVYKVNDSIKLYLKTNTILSDGSIVFIAKYDGIIYISTIKTDDNDIFCYNKRNNDDTKKFNGLKLDTLGDSIMDTSRTWSNTNNRWWKYMLDYLGMKEGAISNKSGTTVADNQMGTSFIDRVKTMSLTGNITIIGGGMNDLGIGNITMGEFDYSKSLSKQIEDNPNLLRMFIPAYRYLIEYILEHNRDTRLYLCTITPRAINNLSDYYFPWTNDTTGVKWTEINSIIRKLANDYGVGLIDFDNCGMYFQNGYANPNNEDENYNIWTLDGVHPTEVYYKIMAKKAISILKNTYFVE